jgi:hypothetical protein
MLSQRKQIPGFFFGTIPKEGSLAASLYGTSQVTPPGELFPFRVDPSKWWRNSEIDRLDGASRRAALSHLIDDLGNK